MGASRQAGPMGTCKPKGDHLNDCSTPLGRRGSQNVAASTRKPEERAPKYAFLGMDLIVNFRPSEDQVADWHHVVPGRRETFLTIAAQHQVPVEKLIGFNFPGSVEDDGRVIPAIVNWYLNHHLEFRCPPTEDGLNRKFVGGEWLAIPRLGKVEIGEAVFIKPTSLDEDLDKPLFKSEKFSYEWKVPKKQVETGYVVWQGRLSIEGEIVQKEGLVKTSIKFDPKKDGLKKYQVKAALEKKLSDNWKFSAGVKADEKVFAAMADGVKNGSSKGFAQAIAAPFELAVKGSFPIGAGITFEPEVGLDFTLPVPDPKKPDDVPELPMPVTLRFAFAYDDILNIDGLEVKAKLIGKGGVNIGPSKKAYAKLAEKFGREALKRFISTAGRAGASAWEFLVTRGIVFGGVVVIGTILGTIAVISLTAWIVNNAKRKGELQGLATWYVSAFSAKVFREERPSGVILGDYKLRDELIRLGELDAVATAKEALQKMNHEKANGTEAQVLEAYRDLLLQADDYKYNTAKWRLQRTVEERSQQLVGL